MSFQQHICRSFYMFPDPYFLRVVGLTHLCEEYRNAIKLLSADIQLNAGLGKTLNIRMHTATLQCWISQTFHLQP